MKSIKWLLAIFFLLFAIKVNAADGCIVDGTLYTSIDRTSSGITYYKNSPAISASNYCIYPGSGTVTCKVGYWLIPVIWWIDQGTGVRGEYDPTYCPIDDDVIYFAIIITGIGTVFIRRQYPASFTR